MFDGFGDYRRLALSVTPDNRLLAIGKFNAYGKAGDAGAKDGFKAVDHQGKSHEVFVQGYEDRVAFSKDGAEWTAVQAARGVAPRAWLWGGVHWHKGYWQSMDSLRDKIVLEKEWATGSARWKIWS